MPSGFLFYLQLLDHYWASVVGYVFQYPNNTRS
jgi:hypothetical protein